MGATSQAGHSRQLLDRSIELYSAFYRRVGGLLTDDPDCGQCIAFASGSSALERRRDAEPFELDSSVGRAFDELSRPLLEIHTLEDELELIEDYPRRVLALLERRKGPPERRTGGRRWIDRRIEAQPIEQRAIREPFGVAE